MAEKQVPAEQKELREIRRFECYVVLDYRKGTFKTTKKRPKNVGAYSIPFKLALDVKMPDRNDLTLKAEVELTASKVKDMFMESL